MRIILSKPETFEKEVSFLPADKIKYLTQKFPRSNYSSLEWAGLVLKEIETVLMNELRADSLIHSNETTVSLSASSELFEQELALHERLDAMIARLVKHLIQTKAFKQMLRLPTEGKDDIRKIPARHDSEKMKLV